VLATVMFTDIVGSTQRAAELGDSGWRDLLDRHNDLVRRHLARHQGREVKTIGDGFLATFDGPARGVRCATEIAEEVRRLGIEIRAGLHTGELEAMDGDVSGMAVNIGARVSALADAGEVLVSGTVRDLVVGSGIEFSDRGTHPLKGVPGEWRLYAVDARARGSSRRRRGSCRGCGWQRACSGGSTPSCAGTATPPRASGVRAGWWPRSRARPRRSCAASAWR
jgi:class 3 adenylate cyclase